MKADFRQVDSLIIPMEILLEADESKESIEGYLPGSKSFGVFIENEMVGACVTGEVGENIFEIFSIAILPRYQKMGLGTRLLEFVIAELRKIGLGKIVLGTGSFGYQLAFYHRAGFRVDRVVKDHFIKNYEEPIFENGIQLKDQLQLSLELC